MRAVISAPEVRADIAGLRALIDPLIVFGPPPRTTQPRRRVMPPSTAVESRPRMSAKRSRHCRLASSASPHRESKSKRRGIPYDSSVRNCSRKDLFRYSKRQRTAPVRFARVRPKSSQAQYLSAIGREGFVEDGEHRGRAYDVLGKFAPAFDAGDCRVVDSKHVRRAD